MSEQGGSASKAGATCTIKGCGKEATSAVTTWQRSPDAPQGKRPSVVKIVPMCADHRAEHEAMGSPDFFLKHPLE